MKILVTRPLEDGEETARLLALRGHQALVAPLLMTRFFDGAQINLDGVQAILATSANGVRALGRRTARRDVALFAVGPQTAAEAQKSGFHGIKSADGDAMALARSVSGWAAPDKGALLHVVGEGNDGKLAQGLPGFTVRREILYSVTPVQSMPAAALMGLREGAIDVALFFSPRSAAVFRDLAGKENLNLERVIAAAISPAAAEALAPLAFRELRIAAAPNQDALLKLLDY